MAPPVMALPLKTVITIQVKYMQLWYETKKKTFPLYDNICIILFFKIKSINSLSKINDLCKPT